MTEAVCELAPDGEPRCTRAAVVRIEDQAGTSAPGCHTHAVRALRAIEGARVYPLPGHEGAAVTVYIAAQPDR